MKKFLAKKPVLNNILYEKAETSLTLIPEKFRLASSVHMDDFGEYSEGDLNDVVVKNLVFKYRSVLSEEGRQYVDDHCKKSGLGRALFNAGIG